MKKDRFLVYRDIKIADHNDLFAFDRTIVSAKIKDLRDKKWRKYYKIFESHETLKDIYENMKNSYDGLEKIRK